MVVLILSNTANPEYYMMLEECINSLQGFEAVVVETNTKLKDKNIPLYTSGEPVTTNDLMNKIVKTSGSGTSKEHLDILKQAQDILHKEGGVNKLIGKEPAKNNEQKQYKLGSKSFSIDQITKAAKASGVSVDEYIKQTGLK